VYNRPAAAVIGSGTPAAGAYLTDDDLRGADLTGICCAKSTIWSDGFKPPGHPCELVTGRPVLPVHQSFAEDPITILANVAQNRRFSLSFVAVAKPTRTRSSPSSPRKLRYVTPLEGPQVPSGNAITFAQAVAW
jgi:hypothetical protein